MKKLEGPGVSPAPWNAVIVQSPSVCGGLDLRAWVVDGSNLVVGTMSHGPHGRGYGHGVQGNQESGR